MLTKKELDKWLEFIRKTLFDVNIAYDNMQRISHSKNKDEESVLTHGFSHHLYMLSRFVIIIQMSKLLSTSGNQKMNLNKLFNRLISDKYDDELNELLNKNTEDADSKDLFKSREEIAHEVAILKNDFEKNQEFISRLVNLRNKYYAHSDPDSELHKVTPEELKTLIDLAINIYEKIWGNLMNVTFLFDSNGPWKIDPLIELQAKSRKERREKHETYLAAKRESNSM